VQRPLTRSTGLRIILVLAGLIAAGTLLLSLPGMAVGGRLPLREALFTAASALTVTGLTMIHPFQALTLSGQVVLLALMQIGGVGFMVGVVLFLRVLGRKIGYLDHLALRDDLGLQTAGSALNLTWILLRLTLGIEALGTAALWLAWRGRLGGGRAAFYALFHAVSAFCNAGFELFSGQPGYPYGIPRDTITLAILGALIFTGGLGLPLLVELGSWDRKRRLSLHTRITLVVVSVLFIAGGISFYGLEHRPGGLLSTVPAGRGLVLAFFQSISARTTGFNGVGQFSALAPASKLLMISLMFIGCAPVSMGGGITTGTFAALVLGAWSFGRGQARVTIAGRSLADFTVQRAAIVLTVSLGVVFLATMAVLASHPATLDEALFEVVSAFATCGLSLDFTRTLNPFGQAVIMAVMIFGRLGPISIMIALSQFAKPSRVAYPQEQILVG